MKAKQYGFPLSSHGVPPLSCLGIGVRRKRLSFAASAAFFLLDAGSSLVLFGSASFLCGACGSGLACCLFGMGISIHLSSGPFSKVLTCSSNGSCPLGPGRNPARVISANLTWSSLSAEASWPRVTGEKPSNGSFLSSKKKKLMMSSCTSNDIAWATSYATPFCGGHCGHLIL